MHGDLTENKCLAIHFKITFLSVCGQVGMHVMVCVGCKATLILCFYHGISGIKIRLPWMAASTFILSSCPSSSSGGQSLTSQDSTPHKLLRFPSDALVL